MAYPTSVKGVLLLDRQVLLVKNPRDEWELPGGRIDEGEDHAVPTHLLRRRSGHTAGTYHASSLRRCHAWISTARCAFRRAEASDQARRMVGFAGRMARAGRPRTGVARRGAVAGRCAVVGRHGSQADRKGYRGSGLARCERPKCQCFLGFRSGGRPTVPRWSRSISSGSWR